MNTSNETRWEEFVQEVSEHDLIWTIEKDGEFVTHTTRYGTKTFPWWSSRDRVLNQLSVVKHYKGYIQSGYEWGVFMKEWVPSLRQSKCLIGINYSGANNVGLDLPVDEVVNAILITKRGSY